MNESLQTTDAQIISTEIISTEIISTEINNQIRTVCTDKSVTCLHAIESGSRAWGFSSPDSDYDVRLVYKREPDWYLRLISGKDTFEYIEYDLSKMPFDVPFDIGGWDIRKALTLLYKSNAGIFEWLNSPIVYQSDDQFIQLIKEIQPQFFDPKALFYHYRGMAKTANASLSESLQHDEPIKLKKWFYLLRALLCSVWTLHEKTHPPVIMAEMFVLLELHEQNHINDLIELKQTVDENYLHQLSKPLKTLTENLWHRGDKLMATASLKQSLVRHQGDIGLLDEVFKKVVFDR